MPQVREPTCGCLFQLSASPFLLVPLVLRSWRGMGANMSWISGPVNYRVRRYQRSQNSTILRYRDQRTRRTIQKRQSFTSAVVRAGPGFDTRQGLEHTCRRFFSFHDFRWSHWSHGHKYRRLTRFERCHCCLWTAGPRGPPKDENRSCEGSWEPTVVLLANRATSVNCRNPVLALADTESTGRLGEHRPSLIIKDSSSISCVLTAGAYPRLLVKFGKALQKRIR